MNWIKDFVKLFKTTPRHQYKKRRYDGAKRDRLSADWLTSGTSADAEIYSSLRTLRNRSRDLCRNNDYARNIIRTFVHNIVLTGIKLQAQVPKLRGEGLDEKTNDKIEAAWIEWCEDADITGYGNFNQLQQLLVRSFVESGEVFIRKIKTRSGNSSTPFALEVLESDQICDDQIGRAWNGANRIKMGVELDNWNRPIAYWVYADHPGDYGFKSMHGKRYLERVPAEEIIHLFLKERPGQTRGVPWLHSSINRLRNLGEYEKSEQIAARASANIAALITTQDADLLEEPTVSSSEEGSELPQEEIKASEPIEPGSLMYLAPGEDVNSFLPNRPNAALPEFNAHMLRGVSSGSGVTYESASRDYSKSNYSSSRLGSIESRDQWRVLQGWFIANFLEKVYCEWLDMAVLSGTLNLINYELHPEHYKKAKWVTRGWEWVDPDKEVKAIQKAINLLLTTRTEEAAKRGLDFEDICKVAAREKVIAEKYGLSLVVSEKENNEPEINKVEPE